LRDARFGGPVPAIPSDAPAVDHLYEQQARELAEHGVQLGRNHGFEARPLWVADDRNVPNEILDEAGKLEVELVVLGARGLAGVRALLGSVSHHVIEHSSCPVLVVPTSSAAETGADREPSTAVATPINGGRAPHPETTTGDERRRLH
jgi:nucleotide-binding universal stress UspA family protein